MLTQKDARRVAQTLLKAQAKPDPELAVPLDYSVAKNVLSGELFRVLPGQTLPEGFEPFPDATDEGGRLRVNYQFLARLKRL